MFLKRWLQAACLCAAAAVALSAASCKKNDTADPNASKTPAQCQLSSSTENYPNGVQQTYGFYYNAANVVDSISAGGNSIFFVKFNYNPSYIQRVYYTSVDTVYSHDSLTLNAAGLLSGYYRASALDTTGIRYSYDGAGQLAYSVMPDFYNDADSSTYTWQNGDYIKRTNNFVDDVTTTYDDTRPSQQGDYLHYQQLLVYSAPILYQTKHLITSLTTATGQQTFTYTLDAGGKITRIAVARANSPYAILYTYNCQ